MGRVSSGKRIRFEKQVNDLNQDLLASVKMFSNGEKVIRLVLNITTMEYFLKDAISGHIYEQGGNVTNQEVLQRKAKKALKKFLDIHFEKETRNVGSKQ